MATPIYVNPDSGNDTNLGTASSLAKKTIANAYSTCDSGGSVYLLDGTYDTVTQGAAWYLYFNKDKSITIKPDPLTKPSITLSCAPVAASISIDAGAANTIHRLESVTIEPTAGSRILTSHATALGRLEIENCIFEASTRNCTFVASTGLHTKELLFKGNVFNSNNVSNIFSSIRSTKKLEISNNTFNTGSANAGSNDDAVISIDTECGDIRISNNIVDTRLVFTVAKTNSKWSTFVIENNNINWNPNDALRCIYFKDTSTGLRKNINVIGNKITIQNTTLACFGVSIGLSESTAVSEFPAPFIIDNVFKSEYHLGTAIFTGGNCKHANIRNNEIFNFARGIDSYSPNNFNIQSNYIDCFISCVILNGGVNCHVANNHFISRSKNSDSRTILFNRVVKSQSSTLTTFSTLTVTDGSTTKWGGNTSLLSTELIAMVNAGVSWYAPLQWGRVTSISSDYVVTVDAWHKFDNTTDVETPTNGNVCKIMEFPKRYDMLDNILDGFHSNNTLTFDFIPIDPESFVDKNVYVSGLLLTNLGSHLVGGSPRSLESMKTKWQSLSVVFPYNDANSQEVTYCTESLRRKITLAKEPFWRKHIAGMM